MRRLYIAFIAFTVLAAGAAITSVTLYFALPDKMTPKTEILMKLRTLMRGSMIGTQPLFAYIIPSDDAHQVSLLVKWKLLIVHNRNLIITERIFGATWRSSAIHN